MQCSNDGLSPVSISFENGGTLYPVTSNFSYSDSEYDYLTAKFDTDTANKIEAELSGGLGEPQRAVVAVNGTPIRAMYYRPEFVRVGLNDPETSTDWPGYIELHDLHEVLKSGTVDYAPRSTTLRDTYRAIVDAAETDKYISGLKITADNQSLYNEDNEEQLRIGFDVPLDKDELIDTEYGFAINFDKISPLRALQKANNIFGVTTHISPEGELVVGPYQGVSSHTGSDSGETSDLHISSAGVTNATKQLKRVNIEGPKIFYGLEGHGLGEAVEEVKEYLNPFQDNDTGLRMQAVVEDRTMASGVTRNIKMHNVSQDEFRAAAERQFIGMQLRRRSGSFTFNMDTSDEPAAVRIGDRLKVDEPSGCGKMLEPAFSGGTYIATGISHRTNPSWKMDVDVLSEASSSRDIAVTIRYLDISSGEAYTHEELYGEKADNSFSELMLNDFGN